MKLLSIFVTFTLSAMAAAGGGNTCMLDVADQCGSCTSVIGDALKACHRVFNDCVRGLAESYGVNLNMCVASGYLCSPE
ncbi:hypothetical protein IF1G_06729 [Cordyceps javanica]|uniref:Uncharacterized protein n=1 Tax=Cordyceps javanica TaxID=43265 RepID=A0A545UZ28_9HYPO|nr:hypothetical protein IF1G_06729 [Cordyceps javanica]